MDFSARSSGGVIVTSSNRLMFDKYLSEIAKHKPLTREEEKSLFKRIKDYGDKSAIEKICKHNLLFVVTVARRYSTALGHSKSLALEDLVNEGNIGLIEAIHRFNPDRDIKFISYAVWWIKQNIIESIQNNIKTIRIPTNAKKFAEVLESIKGELDQTLGFETALSDVFEEMKVRGLLKECDTYDKIVNYHQMSKFETSLNVPAGFDDGQEVIEFLQSDNTNTIETEIYNEEIKKVISLALPNLSELQKKFIVHNFGLNGNEKMCIEDIAEKFDTNPTKVSKEIRKGIETIKLRYSKYLKDFY